MSRHQDYIARIRYQNDLPPPPCAPKLLDVGVNTDKVVSASFLSNLVRKQPLNVDVDRDIGMPLDLVMIQGAFDRGEGFYPYNTPPELDVKDRALLRDPVTASNKGPDGVGSVGGKPAQQQSVSFLRRTEYISSEVMKQQNMSTTADLLKRKTLEAKETTPDSRLKAVEATFDAVDTSLTTLKHPKKKGVTAVKEWSVLPDFKMLDLQYVAVKMVGSASLRDSKRKYTPEELQTSIFTSTTVGKDNWMSFYTADDDTSKKLKEKLEDPSETITEFNEESYKYDRVQDNDTDFSLHPTEYEEIAVDFDAEDNRAYYVPICGRANLKRRRVAKQRREILDEHTVDSVQLAFRDISADEIIARDNVRSRFDPVTYTYTNVEEEEEEKEEEKNEKEDEQGKTGSKDQADEDSELTESAEENGSKSGAVVDDEETE